MSNKKIYIIAGEASGDLLGAKLIKAIKETSNQDIVFYGIGGKQMQAQDIQSLFPISKISLMGFLEIIPHIPALIKLINKTVNNILDIKPDMLITIDSPGFNYSVVKKLRKLKVNFPITHYVAPTVWAYKPKRAIITAKLFDHLLCILPFEKKYFDKVNLDCTYVGHPIIEDLDQKIETTSFVEKYNIAKDDILLCVMPGSRITEIKKIFPVFLDTIKILSKKYKNLKIFIPTIPLLKDNIQKISKEYSLNLIILDGDKEKKQAIKKANIAIVKSGTGALEVSLLQTPAIIAYKVNPLSYFFIKKMVKVKYVNLINIALNSEVIPEFIQSRCKANLMAKSLENLIKDKNLSKLQIKKSLEVFDSFGLKDDVKPSIKAAKTVLNILN